MRRLPAASRSPARSKPRRWTRNSPTATSRCPAVGYTGTASGHRGGWSSRRAREAPERSGYGTSLREARESPPAPPSPPRHPATPPPRHPPQPRPRRSPRRFLWTHRPSFDLVDQMAHQASRGQPGPTGRGPLSAWREPRHSDRRVGPPRRGWRSARAPSCLVRALRPAPRRIRAVPQRPSACPWGGGPLRPLRRRGAARHAARLSTASGGRTVLGPEAPGGRVSPADAEAQRDGLAPARLGLLRALHRGVEPRAVGRPGDHESAPSAASARRGSDCSHRGAPRDPTHRHHALVGEPRPDGLGQPAACELGALHWERQVRQSRLAAAADGGRVLRQGSGRCDWVADLGSTRPRGSEPSDRVVVPAAAGRDSARARHARRRGALTWLWPPAGASRRRRGGPCGPTARGPREPAPALLRPASAPPRGSHRVARQRCGEGHPAHRRTRLRSLAAEHPRPSLGVRSPAEGPQQVATRRADEPRGALGAAHQHARRPCPAGGSAAAWPCAAGAATAPP